MSTLYNLTADLIELYQMLETAYEERGGLTSEEEAKMLKIAEELGSDGKEKLENYAKLLLSLKAKQEAMEYEYSRMYSKAKAVGNTIDRLKNAVEDYMDVAGLKKIEAGAFKFTICKNGGKLPLLLNCLPEALPKEFQKITVDYDKDKLRTALEEGKQFNGVNFGGRGTHLRVR